MRLCESFVWVLKFEKKKREETIVFFCFRFIKSWMR